MTSYEFEVAAKNAVISVLKRDYNEEQDITDISIVWHSYILGYQKAVLIDFGENHRMYEVTYDIDRDEMYVDLYDKVSNTVFTADFIDTKVHKK